MKLLSRSDAGLVLHLQEVEHDVLLTVATVGELHPRPTPRISRGPAGKLPESASNELPGEIIDARQESRFFLRELLVDPDRCPPGQGGYGLRLSLAEAESLLQALNDLKLAQWESLGCPDFEAGDLGPRDRTSGPRLWTIQMVNCLQSALLEALDESA